MKLAVLFPGIGYTCAKPLLYYAGKLAAAQGYKVLSVAYGGFPKDVKGDALKMQMCFASAHEQAEQALQSVSWEKCEDVLFIGKSIGSTVAARYARERGVPARLVLMTPLAETFRFTSGSAIAFHGTGDPWAATAEIQRACREQGIPLHLTEGANHSLETGNVHADLATLVMTMETLEGFMNKREAPGEGRRQP